jgi:diguanylate cyclase (GGDEF)-like protein
LDEVFEYELIQAKRYGIPLSVVLLDIDKFKKVNDTFGHQVGDTVLQEIASLLLKNVRAADTVGRWGGEEFLILCPQTTLEESANIAQKLRESIETHTFPHVVHNTASFGVASHGKNDTKEDIVGRADKALYKAKANGRNQVIALDNSGTFCFPTFR